MRELLPFVDYKVPVFSPLARPLIVTCVLDLHLLLATGAQGVRDMLRNLLERAQTLPPNLDTLALPCAHALHRVRSAGLTCVTRFVQYYVFKSFKSQGLNMVIQTL